MILFNRLEHMNISTDAPGTVITGLHLPQNQLF
jgi:hypothetical protein